MIKPEIIASKLKSDIDTYSASLGGMDAVLGKNE